MTFAVQLTLSDLTKLTAVFDDSPRIAVERAAFTAKQIITRTLTTDVGADQRLSGARNAKVSVGYQMAQGGAVAAQVAARGPWQLFNNPTGKHLIIARGLGTRTTARAVTARLGAHRAFGATGRGMFQGSVRQFSGTKRAIAEGRGTQVKQALTIGTKPRAYALHPGTSGKRTWQRGVDQARPKIAAELADVMRAAVRDALR